MSYRLPKKLENLPKYDPVTETYRVRLDANESFLEMPEEINAGGDQKGDHGVCLPCGI